MKTLCGILQKLSCEKASLQHRLRSVESADIQGKMLIKNKLWWLGRV